MPKIAAQQLHALLRAMEFIHEAADPSQLPQLFADSCARAIPCANASFNLIDRGMARLNVSRSRGVRVPSEEDSPLLRNLSEHPMIMRILRSNAMEVMEFRDFYTRRAFHQTRLFNEYYRRSDTQHQICFQVARSDEDHAVIAINHVSGSVFSEADRAVAGILQRHLAAVFRHARLLSQWTGVARGMEGAVRASGMVPLVLDRRDRPVIFPADAAKLLQRYFREGLSAGGGLPATLLRWVRLSRGRVASLGSPLREPLRVEVSGGCLEVHYQAGAENLLPLLLIREVPAAGMARFCGLERLRELGLTRRESEVLYWISEGKTNPEIAILLDISPRTVHKHAEHIYAKIQVENRQAALLCARAVIGVGNGPSCGRVVGGEDPPSA